MSNIAATDTSESSAVLVPTDCAIPFQDCSQRSGGIGWAQHGLWQRTSQGLAKGRNTNYDLCLSVDIPAGTTIDNFVATLGRMVSRHESLRTRFLCVGDTLVRQEALGSGYTEVTRYRVRAGHAPTDELLRRYVSREVLDVENGHTFRAGFVADAGLVTHAAFAVARIIADGGACQHLISSFIAELSAAEEGLPHQPESVFQQLDQVEWEASPDGHRAEQKALEYWREQTTAIRATPHPALVDGGTMHRFVTPAESVLTATDDVAEMIGATSSAVLLTAFLEATASTLGLTDLGCYLHCSNRNSLELRNSITRLKTLTVYAYSAGRLDFRTAVREVFRGSLNAYRYAQSPGQLFLPRLGISPENAPLLMFNDVRTVVAMDQSTGPARRAEAGSGKPVMTEVPPEDGHMPNAVLACAVGATAGISKRPTLIFETNVLTMDDTALLIEHMQRTLLTFSG